MVEDMGNGRLVAPAAEGGRAPTRLVQVMAAGDEVCVRGKGMGTTLPVS